MQLHLVGVAQQVDKRLPHAGGDVLPHRGQRGLLRLNLRAGDAGSQAPLGAGWERLLHHKHVLRLVEVPGLAQRCSPIAVGEHRVIQTAGG